MPSARFRPALGAAALVVGALALLAAQIVRPDRGEDSAAVLRAVTAAGGAAANASLLYLVAAIALAVGLVAAPAALDAGRGARMFFVATLLTAVGSLWFAIEAALMQVVVMLAGSSGTSGAAQLEALNANFGVLAALPWFFYLAPLGMTIALWRADRAGSWLVGLWVAGFATGFAANSPLGESIPSLLVVNDILLSALFIALAAVIGTIGLRRPAPAGTRSSV